MPRDNHLGIRAAATARRWGSFHPMLVVFMIAAAGRGDLLTGLVDWLQTAEMLARRSAG